MNVVGQRAIGFSGDGRDAFGNGETLQARCAFEGSQQRTQRDQRVRRQLLNGVAGELAGPRRGGAGAIEVLQQKRRGGRCGSGEANVRDAPGGVVAPFRPGTQESNVRRERVVFQREAQRVGELKIGGGRFGEERQEQRGLPGGGMALKDLRHDAECRLGRAGGEETCKPRGGVGGQPLAGGERAQRGEGGAAAGTLESLTEQGVVAVAKPVEREQERQCGGLVGVGVAAGDERRGRGAHERRVGSRVLPD